MKVEEVFKIYDGLAELLKKEIDGDTMWDVVSNIELSEPVINKFKQVSEKTFNKFAEPKGEELRVPDKKLAEYNKEIDSLLKKEVEVDFKKIKYDSLKDKDGKVHGLLLYNLKPIIER